MGGLAASVDDDDDVPSGFLVWYHGSTFVRHLHSHHAPDTFTCGRTIGDAFLSGGEATQPLCRQRLARA